MIVCSVSQSAVRQSNTVTHMLNVPYIPMCEPFYRPGWHNVTIGTDLLGHNPVKDIMDTEGLGQFLSEY